MGSKKGENFKIKIKRETQIDLNNQLHHIRQSFLPDNLDSPTCKSTHINEPQARTEGAINTENTLMDQGHLFVFFGSGP